MQLNKEKETVTRAREREKERFYSDAEGNGKVMKHLPYNKLGRYLLFILYDFQIASKLTVHANLMQVSMLIAIRPDSSKPEKICKYLRKKSN